MIEHFVQFYEEEPFLIDEILGFIGTGLWAGDAGVVIAAPDRLAAVKSRLHGNGLSQHAAHAAFSGEYVGIDATQALSRILIDDWPDEARFHDLIGDVLRRASAGGTTHVRIYEELGATFCLQGRRDAAIRLEALWNTLARQHRFSLLCAYPMNAFSPAESGKVFHEICAAHSHVCLAESFKFPTSQDELKRTIAILHQKSKALESEVARNRRAEAPAPPHEAEPEDIEHDKDAFLAMMANELDSPYAPIARSLASIRAQVMDVGKVIASCDEVLRRTQSMARFVDDMLDISLLGQGKRKLNRQTVSQHVILERALELVRVRPAGHAPLICDLPADPLRIDGDPVRLGRALAYLMDDIASDSRPGDATALALSRHDDGLVLTVRRATAQSPPSPAMPASGSLTPADSLAGQTQAEREMRLKLSRRLIHLHGGRLETREALSDRRHFALFLPLGHTATGGTDKRHALPPAASSCTPEEE